ncbi:MAG: hypothetical protein IID36_05860 [Planctomycetes bacterium]|nr:hypothetical protein [Planctomycetota bacterium]
MIWANAVSRCLTDDEPSPSVANESRGVDGIPLSPDAVGARGRGFGLGIVGRLLGVVAMVALSGCAPKPMGGPVIQPVQRQRENGPAVHDEPAIADAEDPGGSVADASEDTEVVVDAAADTGDPAGTDAAADTGTAADTGNVADADTAHEASAARVADAAVADESQRGESATEGSAGDTEESAEGESTTEGPASDPEEPAEAETFSPHDTSKDAPVELKAEGDPIPEVVIWHHKNGLLELRRNVLVYPNGNIVGHGKVESFWENGNPRGVGELVDGDSVGEWTWWHDNGTMWSRGRYLNNKQEGIWMFWNSDGSIMKTETWLDGVLQKP